MPERANSSVRFAKRRKTKDTRTRFFKDGHDSSFASALRESNEGLQAKQGAEHVIVGNGNCFQEIKQQSEALKAPLTRQQTEGFALKCPISNSLKDHMESIMTELKEAREKLLQWMRQEIQAISATNHISNKETGQRKHQAEYSSNTESVGAQAALQGGLAGEGGRLENSQEHVKLPDAGAAADAYDSHVLDDRASYGILQKNSGLVSSEPVSKIVDTAIKSEPGATSKTVNGLEQGVPNNVNGKDQLAISKVGSPAQDTMNKLPTESRNALFDMCFGAGLGDEVKDVEALDATLESSVTIRDDFEFNKANRDIQKGLDQPDRLRETKNALLDMGFEDEGSNEGNGVGCSLESASSSKANSGFSRASKGIQSGFGMGHDTGIAARFGAKSKEATPASSADVYGSSTAKKGSAGVVGPETHIFVASKRLATSVRDDRRDDKSRHFDSVTGTKSAQPSLKGSGFPAQSSQPEDSQQQAGISSRSGGGGKRSYGSALTFKGSALDSKNDALKGSQEISTIADVFNSATSSVIVMKNSPLLSAADRGKVESLAVQNEGNSIVIPGSAPSWNMFSASKNAMHNTLHDSKVVHVEYASRSKLGDAVLGSGTTLNFQGFDPVFGYAPQYKANTDMMDAYQQERANASSMYFSTLCTNNSDYLSVPNRLMGMQRPVPTASHASSSALRPMLMGMPGHVGGHHDPSNMHTFLGLGMNGVPAAPNGMQLLPGLYLQSNQQHSQGSFKHAPSSTSPMVSQQESSAAQEKAVLELNF